MKTKILFLMACSLLLAGRATAQLSAEARTYLQEQMKNPTDPFQNIYEFGIHEFRSLEGDGAENEPDKELRNKFLRWAEYWKDRCIYPGSRPGGDINGASSTYKNALIGNTFYRCTNSAAGSSSWVSEGPNSNTQGLCNLGIITGIGIDPNNTNIMYAGGNHSGLFKTTNGGSTWANVTDNFNLANLSIQCVAVNPQNSNHIIVGTGLGAFGNANGIGIIESTDGGNTWSVSNIASAPGPMLRANAIKFLGTSPSDPVYAAVDTLIWTKPANAGPNAWTPVSMPSNLIFSQPFMYTCLPDSPAWTTVHKEFTDIEIVTINNVKRVFASTSHYTYFLTPYLVELTSSGAVQVSLPPGATPWQFIALDETPADPGYLYAFYFDKTANCNGTEKYVVAKYNGSTWTVLGQTPPPYGLANIFEMSDFNTNTFLTSGFEVERGTLNGSGGLSFSTVSAYWPSLTVNTHADIRCAATFNSGGVQTAIFGCDGGIIKTTNMGNTWSCINGTGLTISQFYSITSANKTKLITASPQDNWVKRKVGNTWQVAAGPTYCYFNVNQNQVVCSPSIGSESCWSESNPQDDNKMFYSEWDDIVKSFDGGATSINIESPSKGVLGLRFYMDPTNPNTIWTGSSGDSSLYKYTSTGTGYQSGTWQTMHQPTGTSDVGAIAVAPSNANVIIETHAWPNWNFNTTTSKKVYITPDGGSNWYDISGNPGMDLAYKGGSATHVTFDPFNHRKIYMSFGGFLPKNGNIDSGQTRVIRTYNMGNTWTDMSKGLPAFQVNHIVYQNGTDEVLYAATDLGVYRWNKALQQWECFNMGLPPIAVRKIVINYCEKKLYIATYGRGVFSCNLPQTPDFHISTTMANEITNPNTYYLQPSLTIPTYFNQAFANDVIVDAGVKLNLDGTFAFHPNHSFVVGNQAKVVLKGTLTTYCGSLWRGVQIDGNTYSNQNISGGYAINQGLLEITGGTIKNADIGVQVYRSGNALKAGGIIRAVDGNFINNKKDVAFLWYPFSNSSYFTRCKFETQSLLLGGVVPEGHVSMNAINFMRFYGCDFKYSAGNAYPLGSRGYGIYALDSRIIVQSYCLSNTSPCLSTKRGLFENLNIGIYSSNSNYMQSSTVMESDFINNYGDGARFKGMRYLTFVNNYATVNNIYAAGLYLQNCKDYSVQNNTIIGSGSASPIYGIIANNSYGGAHRIYRNTIDKCFVAVSAQFQNAVNDMGLKIRCNDLGLNNPNDYDVTVVGYQPTVDKVQGMMATNCTAAQLSKLVGNRYGSNCQGYLYGGRWYVDPSGIQQIIHCANTGANTTALPHPGCSNYQVFQTQSPCTYNPAQCPNAYATAPSPSSLNSNIAARTSAVSDAQNNYNNLLDGGNTENLLGVIEDNPDPVAVWGELKNASPYLSNDVLKAYFARPGIPHDDIIDIHERNKPVSPDVWSKILEQNFPENIMDVLNTQQDVSEPSALALLEGELALARFEKNEAYADKINYYLNDSSAGSNDTVLAAIQASGFSDYKCQAIAARIAAGDPNINAAEIDQIHGGADFVDDYCKFQKLALTAHQSTDKWQAMNSNNDLRLAVQNIAASSNHLGRYAAQAAMEWVYSNTYDWPYLVPESSGSLIILDKPSSAGDPENIVIGPGKLLQVYPNPARTQVNVLFKSAAGKEEHCQLEIWNTVGQVMHKQKLESNTVYPIDVSAFANGMYMIKLLAADGSVKESKLIVSK